ncbi:MAG TPA: DUF6516 family protein [Deltaproteobacteria bacterium]|nr:DUF6516 family protein [Deltaproteobacteria bacterium]
MQATELVRQHIVYAENKFTELVLWRLAHPLAGSRHPYKYRLEYIVNEVCVLRYDNEGVKGDRSHWGEKEGTYRFSTPEKLTQDFQHDIERWNDENSDS